MYKKIIFILLIIFNSVAFAKLTLSMIVKNEANRYLKYALKEHIKYIDEAVIIDDASTDDTVQVCKKMLKDIPHKIIQNKVSKFKNEVELRKQQWEETVKTNPDWILNLDADEIFEDRFTFNIKNLLKKAENSEVNVILFRLFDFWNQNEYRSDKFWCAHSYYKVFLFKYKKDFSYKWKNKAQHCKRFPDNIYNYKIFKYGSSDLRLKHYGWAKEKDRIKKYKRYKELDPECKFGWKGQWESILDPNPNLVKWNENIT